MRNKPRIRFKGFTEDWEQRKLGQFTARVTRKNGGQSDLPLTISAQDGLVDQRKYFNRQVASRDMSNYYLIKKGEFAYNKSYSEGYPLGAVKRLDYYNIGALSTLYILFEITDKNISSDFIVSYYMTHLWYKEISKRAAEGARNHGLLNISTEDFFDSELNIPNSIEEQVKIGNFIKEFDKFITLHQRKLEKLKLAKKALLQKLFPKNGSQFPEIRFKGFTDAWEQCKLDELTISIGDGLHGTPKYDENGSYYFIKGNNLVDSKVAVTAETKKVAFEALSNDDRRLDSTSILMSINGTIGTLARYNNENIMLGKSVAYITPKNINRDFLFYQLQGNVIQSYFYKNLTGTTIKNLGLGTIKNAIVMSTLSEEESKIGQFFYKLDQFITLHQRKLDKLQEMKKGLLQKMFV